MLPRNISRSVFLRLFHPRDTNGKTLIKRKRAPLHDACVSYTICLTQVLYAEQWGLDHSYLFAIAKCPGDTPMLLAPSENELLQYQVVHPRGGVAESRGGGAEARGGGTGAQEEDAVHVLQAGHPEGLMAYLFAQ